MEELIKKIEEAWEVDEGFFYLLRNQNIDFEKGQSILNILENINFDKADCIKKNHISVLWFIPIFMEWQLEKIKEVYPKKVANDYINIQALILNEIERILGAP